MKQSLNMYTTYNPKPISVNTCIDHSVRLGDMLIILTQPMLELMEYTHVNKSPHLHRLFVFHVSPRSPLSDMGLFSLQWRHNEHDGVSNHQPPDCLTQPSIQAQIKENIKAPRHWPLWGEFTGDRWTPRTRASNAENVSIWWRHHVLLLTGIIAWIQDYILVGWNYLSIPICQ